MAKSSRGGKYSLSGKTKPTLYVIDQSNNVLSADKNPTKFAQKLFDRNYQQARLEFRREASLGKESKEVSGWAGLEEDSDNKSASVRDLRGVQFLIDKEIKYLKFDKELGIIDDKRYNILARALDRVQKTVNNEYTRGKRDGFYR